MRPPPLVEGRPQERIQRHIVEQIADSVPVVRMLFMVEPQMVEQLVDILSPLDFRVDEQVIDVPKILCPPRAARAVLCAPQTAEQLVEVFTPFYLFEQNVDIPVPQVGVSGGGQQGFLSGQGSVGVQNVDIPASGRGGLGSLLGFPPEQGTTALQVSQERISERIVEQIVAGGDFPSRAGPRFVLPGQGSTAAGAEQIVGITSSGGPHGFLPGSRPSSASLHPKLLGLPTDIEHRLNELQMENLHGLRTKGNGLCATTVMSTSDEEQRCGISGFCTVCTVQTCLC